MRKHFGLEVFLAHTRQNMEQPEKWPKHRNYKWSLDDPYQTTLCYLTLPREVAPKATFEAAKFEERDGYWCIAGAQAIAVDLPPCGDVSKRRSRFQRAMRILGLSPRVHPSQRANRTSPELSAEEPSASGTSPQQQSVAAGKSIPHRSYLELSYLLTMVDDMVGWPRLLMLVKTNHDSMS